MILHDEQTCACGEAVFLTGTGDRPKMKLKRDRQIQTCTHTETNTQIHINAHTEVKRGRGIKSYWHIDFCWQVYCRINQIDSMLLPGSRFDGMIPGSVVAVAINKVILRRKKKRAMKVVCA